SVTGGTTNYSYSWTPAGGSLATANNLAAGTYTVTVTDANGCNASATVNITQPNVLSASISSQTNVSCNGLSDGAATVSVTGGTTNYSYSWTPAGGSLATANNLAAGTYTVTVTDANSCNASATVNITQPLSPSISIISQQDPTKCQLEDGYITFNSLNVVNGTYNLTYKKSGVNKSIQIDLNQNQFTLSNLDSGTYQHFVLNTGVCNVILSQNAILKEPVFVTSASSTSPYETGDEIQLMVSSGVEFSWKGPNGFYSNLQTPKINTAKEENSGIYEVIVKGANNCIDTVNTSVVVNCLPLNFTYYLVYGGIYPELIAPLSENLSLQNNVSRPLNIIAIPNCKVNDFESVKLQLSGTSNLQYWIDDEEVYTLYGDGNNGVTGGEYLQNNFYSFISTAYNSNNAQGPISVGPDVIHFSIIEGTRTVNPPSMTKRTLCNGESFTITSSNTGSFVSGNLFRVYLSDKNGLFFNQRLIGFSRSSSSIDCQIPADVLSGNNYKLKIVSSDPVVTSSISTFSLQIIGPDLVLTSPNDDVSGFTSSNRAVRTIQATNNISDNANVEYHSGKHVQLNPGFAVEKGSVFSTSIQNQCPE
ncbi:MAG: hypothetical protein NXI00_22920, partial [Cytophagales bacterium]|nr:hypothetical protein [Cytophagales bacterium]